ncbi:hypothetical protein Goshw_012755 [Gossypium schwendimanii]|uniref:DUF4283 domain-containing protein n=1 Tax=Gossypium schwendimanii TaxID=34291 RepID=A0A7J9MT39_GOSSC|nr:hypothetical protein [Gossypium schwendimanii]
MEEYISSFSLDEVEKDSIQLGLESVDNGISFANCFVRKFLTSSVVHFQAMRSTLANVWHPIGGVSISDLENDRFLFQFYFEVDVDRVERNGRWNFNSHLLVLHCLIQGENSLTLQLTEVNFWIPVNDILMGHYVNTVSDSFDDEMVIREEENSPIHNLDGLKRPRTLSFALGVSANKDSTEASDHCPLILNSKVKSLSTKVHHFRFEAAWLLEDSCETVVKKLRKASSDTIPTRLHKVGEGLDKWFTRVKRERSMSRNDLERQLQRLNELTPSDKVLGDIVDTMLALSLEADKELYWEQRV